MNKCDSFNAGSSGQYMVRVVADKHRGGYAAKLVSSGAGVIMEPNGSTKRKALSALVGDLRRGFSTGDAKLARQIAAAYRSCRRK